MKIRAVYIISFIGILLIAALLVVPRLRTGEEMELGLLTPHYPESLESRLMDDLIAVVNSTQSGYGSYLGIENQAKTNPDSTYEEFIKDMPAGMTYIDVDNTFLEQFSFAGCGFSLSLSPENFSTIPDENVERHVTEAATFDIYYADSSYMSNLSHSYCFFSMPVGETKRPSLVLSAGNSPAEEITADYKALFGIEPSIKGIKVKEIESDIYEAAYLVRYKDGSYSIPNRNLEHFSFFGYIPLEEAVEYYSLGTVDENITAANLSSHVKTYKYLLVDLHATYSGISDGGEYDFPYVFTQEDMIELANSIIVKK